MSTEPRVTDPRAFGRVAVLMGGTSSEREVSLDSGRNCLEALQRRGVDAYAVDGIPTLVAGAGRKALRRECSTSCTAITAAARTACCRDCSTPSAFPYTGSDVLGSALSMDKIRTKQVWLSLGLPTPRYARLARNDDVAAAAT